MSTSEIFDEYVKIAEEKGLVGKTAYVNNDKYIQGIYDNGGRQGSDNLETIELLYPQKKKHDEEKTITEQAHPETVVIAPSYDAFNGVFENDKERQAIMVWIAQKDPVASYNLRRYVKASQNLLNSVVKLGFYLDNENEEALMKLADSCSEQLTKEAFDLEKFIKGLATPAISGLSGAGVGAMVGGVPGAVIGGILGLVGGTALVNNISPADQGVINNIKNAISELKDLNTIPAIATSVQGMISTLEKFLEQAEIVEQLEISSSSDKVSASDNKLSETDVAKVKKVQEYIATCTQLKSVLDEWQSTLEHVKAPETNLPKGLDYLGKLYRWINPNDLKDAELSLQTLRDSLDDTIQHARYLINDSKAKITELLEAAHKSENIDSPSNSSNSETTATNEDDKKIIDLLLGINA